MKLTTIICALALSVSSMALANRELMRELSQPARIDEAKVVYTTGLEQDEFGASFLHWACFEGSAELVAYYLDQQDQSAVSGTVDGNGDTLLHFAIAGDNFEVVQLLIERHANTIAANLHGDTPLIVAVKTLVNALEKKTKERPRYSLRIVNALLEAKADPDGRNQMGETALHFAAQLETINIANALLKAGATSDLVTLNGMTPLRYAVAAGRAKVVELLLEPRRGSRADPNQYSDDGLTPLLDAVRTGHLEIAQILVNAGADVNAHSDEGVSPLMMAAQNNHGRIATFLLSCGAPVPKKNKKRVEREEEDESASAQSEPMMRPPRKEVVDHPLRSLKLHRTATYPILEAPEQIAEAQMPSVFGCVIPSREVMLGQILDILGPAGVAELHAKVLANKQSK